MAILSPFVFIYILELACQFFTTKIKALWKLIEIALYLSGKLTSNNIKYSDPWLLYNFWSFFNFILVKLKNYLFCLQCRSLVHFFLSDCSSSSLYIFSQSVQFSRLVVSSSLWPHGLQHTRPPCPSPTPRVYSNSCLLSRWCHPTTSPSLAPFSSCLHSFPASGSSPKSQFFASGGQSIEVSASSVLPMNF